MRVLDEEGTVERIARGDVWTPQFRAAPERRFRVTLVVDESRSMVVWRQTAHELYILLRWTGAFRDLRLMRMNGDAGTVPESVALAGEHLVLVLSDCVSRAWWDGSAFRKLEEWGQSAAVCLLQSLPEPLWTRTALRGAEGAALRRRGQALANARLEADALDPWLAPALPDGLRLPVATLQPGSVGALASLLANPEGGWSRGIVVPRAMAESAVPTAPVKTPAEERVRTFRRLASPIALRLARLVAVVPGVVSLQVIRLIRCAMVREASQVHEAEVLLGGLLYAVRDPGEDLARTNDIYFELHDGVADLLLDGLPGPDWIEVRTKVSDYAERHWGVPRGFRAFLSDPRAAALGTEVSTYPFARLAAAKLKGRGGEPARTVAHGAEERHGPRKIEIETSDPRLRIMISSTTVDLPEHREETIAAIYRMGHFAVVLENEPAVDSDAIKFSLEKVEQSQVYLGIFAFRYGYIPDDPIRNPDRHSITELEYRHAVKLGIPRLIFLARDSHLFTAKQTDFDEEKRTKLEKLKAELQESEICGFFDSPAKLREEVLVSLQRLEVRLIQPAAIAATAAAPQPLPRPPELYAVPPYILTDTFIGGSSELDRLDAWARSSDPIMVIAGIGGLGKSALTWEWMNSRAPAVIANLAGRVWWSFYEKGTSMVTFVRHALAYLTGQDPEALGKESSHYQRGQQLLAELRRRPYLLVLDGFERVLTAYHQLDDRVEESSHYQRVDLRDCVNPPDGELLTQLLRCAPSKILISTRLFPRELEDRVSRQPIRGVAHLNLNGLSPDDALAFMRRAGVKGDETAMLAFADQFGRHPLLLNLVCGMIVDYRKKPYDFDAWRADPIHGGALKLSELDLKQRYTYILHFALAGLDEQTRKLLCRFAVLAENATYDTLAVLNPFLPPKPEVVEEPVDPSRSKEWRQLSHDEKQKAQTTYRQALELHRRSQEAVQAYYASAEYRRAVKAFDGALKELENRGLLHWDREANSYEIHPVVRGYAAEMLDEEERTAVFRRVGTHFASLPPDDPASATELAHLAHSLEIYRALVGAGRLDEAVSFYRQKLHDALFFQIAAYPVILELLKPLFRNDLRGIPWLASASDQSHVLNDLAMVYVHTGQVENSLPVWANLLKLTLAAENWAESVTTLLNLRDAYNRLHRRAEGNAALSLARTLAEAAGSTAGVTRVIYEQMCESITQGRFAEGERLDADFQRQPRDHRGFYRPGGAEFCRCESLFFQGKLTIADWQAGHDLAVQHRNVHQQHRFLALRAEWDLSQDRPVQALEAIDQALQLTNQRGTSRRDYHDVRACTLARLGRPDDALAELQEGEGGLFAAETYQVLGDNDQARACALNAYRWAWGEGPPFIDWYYLERSRELLRQLGLPEPQLQPFDPSKVQPIPFEREIRAAIQRLGA
jgi:tetratricopeptide (TPR) repeat protein